MTILIQGGSGSGKSAYAEAVALSLRKEREPLYYLATMKVYDEEGKKKVERHRQLRAGKGFLTIEQPVQIGKASGRIEEGSIVLLECMSNLAANEMFAGEVAKETQNVICEILEGVHLLSEKAEHLIIVTNNVFEDGIRYEEMTRRYIEALGQINCGLALLAEEVVEIVAGIPVPLKKRKGIYQQ